MNDEESRHAKSHLRHLIMVRVIHVGAVLAESEFVFECFVGLNCLLVKPSHAIHAVGQQNPMPVDAGAHRKFVTDINADTVALDRFNGRPMDLAVVAPASGFQSGREFVTGNFLGACYIV